jgi:hypothetical protein
LLSNKNREEGIRKAIFVISSSPIASGVRSQKEEERII